MPWRPVARMADAISYGWYSHGLTVAFTVSAHAKRSGSTGMHESIRRQRSLCVELSIRKNRILQINKCSIDLNEHVLKLFKSVI